MTTKIKTRVMVVLAGLIMLASAQAADVTRKEVGAEALRVYLDTKECMRQSGVAMMRNGLRDEESLVIFAVNMCGLKMLAHSQTYMGWSADRSAAFVVEMATKEAQSNLRK